ncbi:hypothetical protein ACFL27_17215 [candidate division CSSED10-310 bacterium]|uniref:Uncharacterized protein n=1 Tax=candidate division CSSED10-310 bacterium TaxID=2855610 RepID=A0ABV6Z0G1_UNCC1
MINTSHVQHLLHEESDGFFLSLNLQKATDTQKIKQILLKALEKLN